MLRKCLRCLLGSDGRAGKNEQTARGEEWKADILARQTQVDPSPEMVVNEDVMDEAMWHQMMAQKANSFVDAVLSRCMGRMESVSRQHKAAAKKDAAVPKHAIELLLSARRPWACCGPPPYGTPCPHRAQLCMASALGQPKSEVSRRCREMQLDHTLLPQATIRQAIVQASAELHTRSVHRQSWHDGLHMELTLHCMFGVLPIRLWDGRQMPAAVQLRCVDCHSKWHECHNSEVHLLLSHMSNAPRAADQWNEIPGPHSIELAHRLTAEPMSVRDVGNVIGITAGRLYEWRRLVVATSVSERDLYWQDLVRRCLAPTWEKVREIETYLELWLMGAWPADADEIEESDTEEQPIMAPVRSSSPPQPSTSHICHYPGCTLPTPGGVPHRGLCSAAPHQGPRAATTRRRSSQ